jgi:hypothetical protein
MESRTPVATPTMSVIGYAGRGFGLPQCRHSPPDGMIFPHRGHCRGADLAGATLERVDLRGADLTDACMAGADLSDAMLDGAQGVNLTGAQTLRPPPLRPSALPSTRGGPSAVAPVQSSGRTAAGVGPAPISCPPQ